MLRYYRGADYVGQEIGDHPPKFVALKTFNVIID
jgi:hypothetical protein